MSAPCRLSLWLPIPVFFNFRLYTLHCLRRSYFEAYKILSLQQFLMPSTGFYADSSSMYREFLNNLFWLLLFFLRGGCCTPHNAQGLPLTLHSRITLRTAWGTIGDTGDWTWVGCVQEKHPSTLYCITLQSRMSFIGGGGPPGGSVLRDHSGCGLGDNI